MIKKFCKCGKIISQELKMCTECQTKYDLKINKEINKAAYKKYKANRKDLKEQRFYSSSEWIFTRDVVKQRDHGFCKLCESKNTLSFVDSVHHIEEIKDNWSKRTNMDNLICLCDRCHYYVHKKYNKSITDKKMMQDKLRELVKG